MRDGMKFSRGMFVLALLLGIVATMPGRFVTEAALADGGVFVAGEDEQSNIIPPDWAGMPLLPRYAMEEADANAYTRPEDNTYDFFKAVPAPDGGIYLFVSAHTVGTSNCNIYVEHYDRDFNFVTSPDLGLHLLGFPPYVERHRVHLFGVIKSGENYFLAFTCWDRRTSTILLMKYDRDLKPLYKRPVFLDYGRAPALVEGGDRLHLLYLQNYKDQNKKNRIGIFRMEIYEENRRFEDKDNFIVHRLEKEMLPLEYDAASVGLVFPSAVYDPQQKEYCLVYSMIMKREIWGKHFAQMFDENWQKKGAPVSLFDRARQMGMLDRIDSIIPCVALRDGKYYFFTDGVLPLHKTGIPKFIRTAALLKADGALAHLAGKVLFCKMKNKADKIDTGRMSSCDLVSLEGGLAAVSAIGYGAAICRFDADLNVTSAAVLTGGIPKKADLLVNASDIEKYPPRGILGCEQLIRVPVDNRGMRFTPQPVSVEMYYGNDKVGTAQIPRNLRFARRSYAEIKWTVPDNIQQQEIELRFKVDPDNTADDAFPGNNEFTIKMPVWDKGMVRGYLSDGSLSVIDWMPLDGAKVSLTAPGFGAEAVADARGYYEFDRVPFGNYHIKIQKDGYNPLEQDRELLKRFPVVTMRDSLNNHGRFEVTVQPPNAVNNQCEVLLTGGKFTDIDAEAIGGGKYAADVPAGKYRVRITSPGFLPCENTDAQVNLGQTTSLTVTLEEATFSIVRGYVCDEYGDPIVNAEVTFKQKGWQDGESERPAYTAHSDEVGNFRVELTGYEKKTVQYEDTDGKTKTRIERGDKVKGRVSWAVNASGSTGPKYSDEFSGRTGYEEYCEIALCEPDQAPRKVGALNGWVPWTAKADFPGFMLYPELHAGAWYGIYAMGIGSDYNPKKDEMLTLSLAVQGLAYEMHAVSGKFSSMSEPKSTGWKKWGTYAWRVGSRLWKLKNYLEDEPQDSNEVPTVFEELFETIKQNIGKTLFIPGVDKHSTSVRVDLIRVVSTSGDDKGEVLWSDDQQWYSHSSPDDEYPNSHLREFRLPRGINRKKAVVEVYVKIQKLLLDGRTPDGLVPFYTNQYIKMVFNPGNGDLKAYYEAEYNYLKITGLSFE